MGLLTPNSAVATMSPKTATDRSLIGQSSRGGAECASQPRKGQQVDARVAEGAGPAPDEEADNHE